MPCSLVKKIIRGHPYWYARECRRIDGVPKITWQKYLGKADDIVAAIKAPAQPPPPRKVVLGDFAGPAALLDVANSLDLIPTIDRHAGKRAQGISIGVYITLAALNRCLAPTSKARMAEWYQSTVLPRIIPVTSSHLTSQRFWDHMNYLDAPKIEAIEHDLTRILIERYDIDLSCLLYDTTNFMTYIDTFNEAASLAQRGKSKEKRSDLRIVGLALLVTRDFHIPLFHHVYSGNTHDSTTFASVTESLVARYRLFAQQVQDITLVYDKGNNSEANQEQVAKTPFHYVGSLCPTQHPDLLQVSASKFRTLDAEDLEDVRTWRTRKTVLGKEQTIVVAYNPELFLTQCATILREVRKRTRQLRELQIRLLHPSGRGKPITVESAQKQVAEILKGRHMKYLFQVHIRTRRGRPKMHYIFNRTAWNRLQRTLLGKNILFTDQEDWTDAQIVRAYRAQYHIEDAFKTMKNPHFVSWRPMFHWTDQKIRVHAFYCVVALLLISLLRRILAQKNIELSTVKLLETLCEIKEVALFYRNKSKAAPKPVITYSVNTPLQKKLMSALDLSRFQAM